MNPISIFAGPIGSIAQKVFIEPSLNKFTDKLAAEKELKGAIQFAVKHTEEKFSEYFVPSNGCLDESFWKNPEINEQLWKTITDDTTPGRSPDFAILYNDVYCSIYEKPARISYDLFSRVLEEFWKHFLANAKESQIFKIHYQRKIIFQLDETVYHHEGKQMMAEYCRTMAEKLEKKTFSRFFPKELKNSDLTDEQINREFFDYKRTRLTYEQKHDSSARHNGEVVAIEGDSFLDHGKIVFIGPGGVGKTRFMVELVRKLVGKIAASQTDPEYLPIYFEASEFAGATKTFLTELLETKLRDGLPSGVYSDAKIRGFIQYLLGDPHKEESGKLFAVIDAFDQIRPEQGDFIFRLCADNVLLGKCRTYVSSRPYRLEQLRGGIQRAGGDVDTFQTILIHPFAFNELTLFFKGYYDRIEPFIKRLNRDQGDDINLVQLPLFARLTKIMAIKKRFLPIDEIGLKSRAGLMRYFVDFMINEQVEKDKVPDQDSEVKKSNYYKMVRVIEQLSLKTLEAGQIYEFDDEFAEELLGDSFLSALPLLERIEFISHILDYEGEASFLEPRHRYQHQIFQEYLAAVALYKLYRKSKKDPQKGKAMRLSMENMEYMPEVAGFLADLVEEKGAEDDFHNWQKLLMAENNEDWVRTYALHMRDVLGKSKAQDALKRLFEEENNDLMSYDSSLMVHVPEGSFIRGSYEYEDERPVTLISLDAFGIGRHPVTNREFLEFLNDHYKRSNSYEDESGNEIIDFGHRIEKTGQGLRIKDTYEDHPVVNVSWHGAMAYCKWRSEKEQKTYRLPFEAEWEKAARGCCGRRYPWGNEFDKERCNTLGSGIKEDTTVIGKYDTGVSPYSCHDMAGNVWEWCHDRYEDGYYRDSIRDNPQGPPTGSYRVIRGGSWINVPRLVRSADRGRSPPVTRDDGLGFRLVLSPGQ